MRNLYLDAGTTWAKIIETEVNGSFKSKFDEKYLICTDKNSKYFIIPSKDLNTAQYNWTKATGHMSMNTKDAGIEYVNEAIALAQGAKNADINESEFTVLDLGSRDIKWVKFKNSKFSDLDWNSACASATGATVEMLLKFYDIDTKDLAFNKEKYNITCGIFGLEKIMDDIARGVEPKNAIAKFVHGLAFNAWSFSGKPNKVYLSGGFCGNKCFVESLKLYTEVELLGRFTLVKGLME